jgi:hypothetical protein
LTSSTSVALPQRVVMSAMTTTVAGKAARVCARFVPEA